MPTTTPTPTLSFVVQMVAQPDQGDALAAFLTDALDLANDEAGTLLWFAVRTDEHHFWIFDAFASEAGRQEHLTGKIADAMYAQGPGLFAERPQIHPSDILAAKLP